MSNTTSFFSDAQNTEFLLEHARGGRHEAWEAIYRRYRALLILAVQMKMPGYARRRFDAEDVLQSAFLSAWSEIASFEYRGEGSLRRWLKQIVVRHFLNKLRKQAAEQRGLTLDTGAIVQEALGDKADDESQSPSQRISEAESQAHIIECLADLDEEDQEILCMRIFEGMPFSRIAEIIECSVSSAHERYRRAVHRLQKRMG